MGQKVKNMSVLVESFFAFLPLRTEFQIYAPQLELYARKNNFMHHNRRFAHES
jgi:hypothetical protein